MNEDQKKKVKEAIESHRRAIELLQDEEMMSGIFESLEALKRGDKGVRGKDLKRKYERA
jgi:hypothetical protein